MRVSIGHFSEPRCRHIGRRERIARANLTSARAVQQPDRLAVALNHPLDATLRVHLDPGCPQCAGSCPASHTSRLVLRATHLSVLANSFLASQRRGPHRLAIDTRLAMKPLILS